MQLIDCENKWLCSLIWVRIQHYLATNMHKPTYNMQNRWWLLSTHIAKSNYCKYNKSHIGIDNVKLQVVLHNFNIYCYCKDFTQWSSAFIKTSASWWLFNQRASSPSTDTSRDVTEPFAFGHAVFKVWPNLEVGCDECPLILGLHSANFFWTKVMQSSKRSVQWVNKFM